MTPKFDKIFLDHPRSVGESYFQHLTFAARFAGSLFVAAFCALVHALIPCLFTSTASKIVRRLAENLARR